ncbi:hypothetical protein [Rhodovulum bhavnagarense]|uniref:hypothetical protein n=1 Tax=Rhodovulum bhavnagarense TaxID=992286 RepID=UPI00104641DD|nr:hypothetical protein [Rhodovulum bhavnagarense]
MERMNLWHSLGRAWAELSAGQAGRVDEGAPGQDRMRLAHGPVQMDNRGDVERLLPDILGRALARSWIDQDFRGRFTLDPVGTLADYRVQLPDTISIEVGLTDTLRPRVIVYERDRVGRKRRLLSLKLIMTADQ